jgi:hypothetical protein
MGCTVRTDKVAGERMEVTLETVSAPHSAKDGATQLPDFQLGLDDDRLRSRWPELAISLQRSYTPFGWGRLNGFSSGLQL